LSHSPIRQQSTIRMETTQRTSTPLTAILAMLLTLGVVGGLYLDKTRTLTDRFDQEERRADSLLSVKLQLEGDIRSLTSQLETADDENESLGKRISALHEQLYQRDALEKQLRQQNRLRTGSIQGLHRNLDSLTIIRDSLENQLTAMTDKISWMNDEQALLLNQTKELQQKINELNTSLLTKVPRSAITGDDFMVEATKSNRKETAKAKKVNTLTISLNVPTELQVDNIQDVFVSLTDNQHNPIMPPLRTTTVVLSDINEVVPIHAIQRVIFTGKPKRISISLTPDKPLKPGIYRASVYTKTAYLGSVDFQLRDSFWFF
jgi:phage shock protein A